MTKENYIVAIEIGSSKIKAAVAAVEPGGALVVKAFDQAHLSPNSVRYGQVQNVKEVAAALGEIVQRMNSSIAPAYISGVYIGVGGRSLKTTRAQLESVQHGDVEITREIIEGLLNEARSTSPDHELLDVVPVEFSVDSRSLGLNPIGVIGHDVVACANIITIRQQLLRNLQLAVADKLHLNVQGYVVRPMALGQLVLTSDEQRLGVMMVDCGAETTTVAIFKKGALQYLNTIPLGSRHITRDLTSLPCTEERAEEIKRSIGNAVADSRQLQSSIAEIDSANINKYVQARAGEIACNVEAQMQYAGFNAADLPCGIVACGGGADLKGFTDLLGRKCHLSVRRGAVPASLRLEGVKLRNADDLDIIALLSYLATDTILPCVSEPDPEPEPEPTPEPEPQEEETVIEQTDETDIDEDIESIETKRPGLFGKLWSNIKKAAGPIDDSEEEEF